MAGAMPLLSITTFTPLVGVLAILLFARGTPEEVAAQASAALPAVETRKPHSPR